MDVAGILINFAPDENKLPLFVAIGNFDAVSVFGQSGNRKGDKVRVTCIKVVETERKSFGIPCEIIDPQVNLSFLVQHEPAIGINVFDQACPEMGVEDAFNSPRIEIPVFPDVFKNLTAVGFDPQDGINGNQPLGKILVGVRNVVPEGKKSPRIRLGIQSQFGLNRSFGKFCVIKTRHGNPSNLEPLGLVGP